ncbi:Hypothetical predicted protein [Podarcis lilfordi]|uniref:Uncharacterized protein n=1 Tax=Podarcis lilfordi TaxID=74358 RepID=A0AA35PBU3_9SAUR|nr:Hypothetical predicted protein [Podarcis lilfordi]
MGSFCGCSSGACSAYNNPSDSMNPHRLKKRNQLKETSQQVWTIWNTLNNMEDMNLKIDFLAMVQALLKTVTMAQQARKKKLGRTRSYTKCLLEHSTAADFLYFSSSPCESNLKSVSSG